MPRSFSTILGATLVMGCGSALAQGGDLAGVTMRVLDDVSDVHAVVIELDALRGQGEEGADRDGGTRDEANAAGADAGQATGTRAEADHLEEPRGRAELHHPDDDENAEGKLEDDDVERPAAPPAP
ncbi:MAG TPA: hypothetical protein VNA66_10490 [Gammaproteobacteria bacterium]|nr:hypothetical protein [Gammaproteobacteria bacterium]